MQFFYGSYAHDENELTVQAGERIERSASGVPTKKTITYTILGRKIGNPASITQQLADLRSAYSVDGMDFVGLDDDGNGTYYRLINAETFSGVRVVEAPHLPQVQGADYATKVDYKIVLEAVYLFNQTDSFDDFTQTVEIEGGGPLRVVLMTPEGSPIEQIVAQQTPYRARQSGSGTSFSPNSSVPPPLWPAARSNWAQPTRTSFYDGAVGRMRYRFNWNYEFLSVTALS